MGKGGTFYISPTGCLLWQALESGSPIALVLVPSDTRTYRDYLIFNNKVFVQIGRYHQDDIGYFGVITNPILIRYAKTCGYDKEEGMYYFQPEGD